MLMTWSPLARAFKSYGVYAWKNPWAGSPLFELTNPGAYRVGTGMDLLESVLVRTVVPR